MPQLYAITTVYNPAGYESRFRLYREFAKRIEKSGVALYTVELATGDQDFAVTDAEDPRHIRLRSPHTLWYKENLINIAIARLPRDWEYVAWLDADIQFLRPDWVTQTISRRPQTSPKRGCWSSARAMPGSIGFFGHTPGLQKPVYASFAPQDAFLIHCSCLLRTPAERWSKMQKYEAIVGTRRLSCWTGKSATCSNAKSRAFMSALLRRAIFVQSRQPMILPGCIPFRASSGDLPHCCCLRSVEGGYTPPASRSGIIGGSSRRLNWATSFIFPTASASRR